MRLKIKQKSSEKMSIKIICKALSKMDRARVEELSLIVKLDQLEREEMFSDFGVEDFATRSNMCWKKSGECSRILKETNKELAEILFPNPFFDFLNKIGNVPIELPKNPERNWAFKIGDEIELWFDYDRMVWFVPKTKGVNLDSLLLESRHDSSNSEKVIGSFEETLKFIQETL